MQSTQSQDQALNTQAQKPDEKHFDRSAWLSLILAVFTLLFGVSVPVILFKLPTEGWLSTLVADSADNMVYKTDLLGINTGLQKNDRLVAVEGVPVSKLNPATFPRDHLAIGDVIVLTVQRGDDQVQVNATMAHWTWKAIAVYNLGNTGSWLTNLTAIILFAVGFYVFVNRPRYPAAQALLVLNTIMAMVFTMAGLVPNSIASVVTPAMSIFFEISLAMVFSLLFPPSLIRFGLVFPRMKRPIESHAALQFFPYAIGLLVFLVFRTGFWLIGYLWMMIALLLTVGLLVHSGLKAHDSVSRAQVRWGILGAVLGLGLFLISYLSIFDLVTGIAGTVLGSFGSLGVAVFGVTLGIAILRYRLFDIDVIIRRTLVYTVLTTVLLAIYFASVVAFQELFQLLTGQHQSSIATVLSTLAIAALFYPLRKRIQSGIDHRFYRRRYNAELTLEAFAATLRDEVDLDQLGNHLVAVIQATMQPESVSLWLRETKKPSPLDRVHG